MSLKFPCASFGTKMKFWRGLEHRSRDPSSLGWRPPLKSGHDVIRHKMTSRRRIFTKRWEIISLVDIQLLSKYEVIYMYFGKVMTILRSWVSVRVCVSYRKKWIFSFTVSDVFCYKISLKQAQWIIFGREIKEGLIITQMFILHSGGSGRISY